MSTKLDQRQQQRRQFFTEATRFREFGDNGDVIRKRMIQHGNQEQAVLVDQLRWLRRPDKLVAVDDPFCGPFTSIFGAGSSLDTARKPFNFGTIPDENIDAVPWLEDLGALRIYNHFQCHWAACTMVVTEEGWSKDKITRRGKRWETKPPELLRAVFLLHWQDHKGVFADWTRHLARLQRMQAINEVNNFTRHKMVEDGFFRRIFPSIPVT
jgi:hypothetical protein